MNAFVGIVGLAALIALLLLRIPISISLIVTSFVGIATLIGIGPALSVLSSVPYDFTAKWTLSSVPMFLFMGYICFHSGLTKRLFAACRSWLAWLPGGLCVASIFGCGGFAAVTGSSVACAAAMGRIAVPELLKNKYDPSLATGAIAAAGTLGALIPPSIILIIFGAFAEVPISKLFLGGAIIGGVTALAYVALAIAIALVRPDLAPRIREIPPLPQRLRELLGAVPLFALITLIVVGMMIGLFTATEAGAAGALAALVVSYLNGDLNRQAILDSIIDTLTTTSVTFMIAIGAGMLTKFLALSGATDLITTAVIGLGANQVMLLIAISLLYMVVGMFLEPVGAMLLTLPILLPILDSANIDLIWFGVFLAKLLEMGMLTPPVGLNVFVIKASAGDEVRLEQVFRGVMVFLAVDVAIVLGMIGLMNSLGDFLNR